MFGGLIWDFIPVHQRRKCMSALVLVRMNLGPLHWVSFNLTWWQLAEAARLVEVGGWDDRASFAPASDRFSASPSLQHLSGFLSQSVDNSVPLQHVGFPHCGVLPHSLFWSCNKNYKPIDQPKQQQKRRIMLIKLHCKTLNQISFSINSSISFGFILRKEQHLQPGDINSFMPFLMKQDTPACFSSLISPLRPKIFLNREWLSSGRKIHWEDKVCVSIPCS